ncbi:MAG: hypothetical protein K2Q09_00995, partial [Phycisphaerales bacterium]|nr:hypothetical protein [Phycisphaerales bacterium]
DCISTGTTEGFAYDQSDSRTGSIISHFFFMSNQTEAGQRWNKAQIIAFRNSINSRTTHRALNSKDIVSDILMSISESLSPLFEDWPKTNPKIKLTEYTVPESSMQAVWDSPVGEQTPKTVVTERVPILSQSNPQFGPVKIKQRGDKQFHYVDVSGLGQLTTSEPSRLMDSDEFTQAFAVPSEENRAHFVYNHNNSADSDSYIANVTLKQVPDYSRQCVSDDFAIPFVIDNRYIGGKVGVKNGTLCLIVTQSAR